MVFKLFSYCGKGGPTFFLDSPLALFANMLTMGGNTFGMNGGIKLAWSRNVFSIFELDVCVVEVLIINSA